MPDYLALGIELAERATTAVAVDEAGRVVGRTERDSASGAAVGAAREALAAAGAASGAPRVGLAAEDPGASGSTEAAADLQRAFGGALPGVIGSGSAAALAEAWCGAARGARHVVYFAIANHTSAGVVSEGRVWAGAHGLAASVAWLALNPVEREDYRKLGCLEAEVGAAGIVRRLIWRIKAGDRSRVLDLAGGDMDAITVDHLFDGARNGDGVAISVVRDTAKYLGMAIANLAIVVDPEVVVLGGAIASAGDLLLEPVRTESARRLPPPLLQSMRIELSSLGADAPAIGAARLAMTAGT